MNQQSHWKYEKSECDANEWVDHEHCGLTKHNKQSKFILFRKNI